MKAEYDKAVHDFNKSIDVNQNLIFDMGAKDMQRSGQPYLYGSLRKYMHYFFVVF